MILLPRRALHAIAAVLDVALHARPAPVTSKALAARHQLPPRHLEPILQALVRSGLLRGTRGPRGGYELGADRRHITVGDILRATQGDDRTALGSEPDLVRNVVGPAVADATGAFVQTLDRVTVEDLCRRAALPDDEMRQGDFAI